MLTRLDLGADHPAFVGHFPGFPVMPGALLLDEALHAITRRQSLDLTCWLVASVKFLALVRPGDGLLLEHTAPGRTGIRFSIRSGDVTVLSGSLAEITHGA